jgi:hypothetical protein
MGQPWVSCESSYILVSSLERDASKKDSFFVSELFWLRFNSNFVEVRSMEVWARKLLGPENYFIN